MTMLSTGAATNSNPDLTHKPRLSGVFAIHVQVCVYVCIYVCLSVCQTITFERLYLRTSYLHIRGQGNTGQVGI